MFKKTLGFVTVAAAVVSLGLASVTTANADVTDATNGSTQANVNLQADESGAGGVSLVQVPTLTFADKTLTGTADHTDLTVGNNLVVKNGGAVSGWKVTASATAMRDKANTDQLLNGGSYDLKSDGPDALAVGADYTTPDTTNSTKATVNSATATDNTTFNGLHMDTGEDMSSRPVMSAIANQGIGTFSANFGSKSQLNIPASAVAGQYESTITWTLTNTPA